MPAMPGIPIALPTMVEFLVFHLMSQGSRAWCDAVSGLSAGLGK
jgi:hypothetical protein